MSEQQKRWLKRIGWGLFLFICVFPCAACAVARLPIVREYQANRLDYILGEVEPVFLAGDHLSPFLSPDGKWFFVVKHPARADGTWEAGMMDIETYNIYTLNNLSGAGAVWIDSAHFMIGPMMVRVPEMIMWQVQRRSTDPQIDSLDILAEANYLVALEGYTARGSLLVSTNPNLPYTVSVSWIGKDLAKNLAGIPHTIVPESEWDPLRDRSNTRLYSPDGKYFVSGGEYSPEEDTYHPQRPDQWKSMKHPSSIIFDAQTEKMVAMARKEGWGTTVLGWAADSSGVYLQFLPLGGDTGGFPAGSPTYKLLVPGQQPSGKTPTFVDSIQSGGPE